MVAFGFGSAAVKGMKYFAAVKAPNAPAAVSTLRRVSINAPSSTHHGQPIVLLRVLDRDQARCYTSCSSTVKPEFTLLPSIHTLASKAGRPSIIQP
jgi:hypothetical protein